MKKAGFTIIEMIFSIVILSIIALFSSDLIYRTYESYHLSQSISNSKQELKRVSAIIEKYLKNSIFPSIVRFDGVNYISLQNSTKFDANKSNGAMFMWIGKDVESFRGLWDEDQKRIYPGYSSICNVKDSNDTTIVTVDCNLSFIQKIVGAILEDDNIYANQKEALYFVYANSDKSTKERFWQNDPYSLFPINSVKVPEKKIVLSKKPDEISDKYYLSYSAYAIELDDVDNVGDLYFYWNFRPWNNEDASNADKQLLAQNITEFKMWDEGFGGGVGIKMCMADNIRAKEPIIFCKEMIVFR